MRDRLRPVHATSATARSASRSAGSPTTRWRSALAYDDGGRQRGRTLTVKGAKRYENTVTRDDAGRITKRVETVDGTTKTYDYEYYPDGELKTVKDGATVLESYTYDANGNRAGRTYADDDRMTGTHVYDAAGFLVSRGADTFTYADRGELQDGHGRRRRPSTYDYDAVAAAGRRASRAACARSSSTATRRAPFQRHRAAASAAS